MGTLLSAYEDFPAFFDTLHTHIPPMPGPPYVPDLLNESLYNLRWMLTMQDPNDGGVYHKCTNAAFDGMVMPGVDRMTVSIGRSERQVPRLMASSSTPVRTIVASNSA